MYSMEVLTALYQLKDKSQSLDQDDRAFVLRTIAVHESGQRQLNRQETRRIVDLDSSTRHIRGACAHSVQEPVLKDGELTDKYECAMCLQRF